MSTYTPMTYEIRARATAGGAPIVHRRELGITVTQAERIAAEEFDRWLTALLSDASKVVVEAVVDAAAGPGGASVEVVPDGWLPFGTCSAPALAGINLEFSDEVGDDGLPLYERPIGTVVSIAVDDARQVETVTRVLYQRAHPRGVWDTAGHELRVIYRDDARAVLARLVGER